jgi:hypothetical protein
VWTKEDSVSQFSIVIQKVVTNGPYSYNINKDTVGQKTAINQASVSAALDAVKADIGAMLGGETVDRITMNVLSS